MAHDLKRVIFHLHHGESGISQIKNVSPRHRVSLNGELGQEFHYFRTWVSADRPRNGFYFLDGKFLQDASVYLLRSIIIKQHPRYELFSSAENSRLNTLLRRHARMLILSTPYNVKQP